MRFKNKFILLFLLLVSGFFCPAEQLASSGDPAAQQHAEQPAFSTQAFDKKVWTDLKKKLKIKDYAPKKKDEPKNKKPWNLTLSPKWSLIIKWTLFAVIIILLLFLVLQVLGINPFNKKTDPNRIDIGLDELEENLDTASIDPHLYAAIKSKNFKLAIRLYYLMILQKLALKEKITWKKYKTNQHYLNELRNKEEYPTVKKLTLLYEQCWFGEREISEPEYDRMNGDFVNFLQNIQ